MTEANLDPKALEWARVAIAEVFGGDDEPFRQQFEAAAVDAIRAYLRALPAPDGETGCEYCVDGLQADGETPCPCCTPELSALQAENEKLRRERDGFFRAAQNALRTGSVLALEGLYGPHTPISVGTSTAALSDSPAAEPVAGQGEDADLSPEEQAKRDVAEVSGEFAPEIAAKVSAALRPAPVVVVKPLEWREIGEGYAGFVEGEAYVGSIEGEAWARIEHTGNLAAPYWYGNNRYAELPEAKAAAQADYEACIRSALVPAPVPSAKTSTDVAVDVVEALRPYDPTAQPYDEPLRHVDPTPQGMEQAVEAIASWVCDDVLPAYYDIPSDVARNDPEFQDSCRAALTAALPHLASLSRKGSTHRQCPTCHGDGNDITGVYDHCQNCDGTGEVPAAPSEEGR